MHFFAFKYLCIYFNYYFLFNIHIKYLCILQAYELYWRSENFRSTLYYFSFAPKTNENVFFCFWPGFLGQNLKRSFVRFMGKCKKDFYKELIHAKCRIQWWMLYSSEKDPFNDTYLFISNDHYKVCVLCRISWLPTHQVLWYLMILTYIYSFSFFRPRNNFPYFNKLARHFPSFNSQFISPQVGNIFSQIALPVAN